MRGFASTLSSLSTQRSASRWYLEGYPSSPSSLGRNFTGRQGKRQASDRPFALSIAALALASHTRVVFCFNPKECQVIFRYSRTIQACEAGRQAGLPAARSLQARLPVSREKNIRAAAPGWRGGPGERASLKGERKNLFSLLRRRWAWERPPGSGGGACARKR